MGCDRGDRDRDRHRDRDWGGRGAAAAARGGNPGAPAAAFSEPGAPGVAGGLRARSAVGGAPQLPQPRGSPRPEAAPAVGSGPAASPTWGSRAPPGSPAPAPGPRARRHRQWGCGGGDPSLGRRRRPSPASRCRRGQRGHSGGTPRASRAPVPGRSDPGPSGLFVLASVLAFRNGLCGVFIDRAIFWDIRDVPLGPAHPSNRADRGRPPGSSRDPDPAHPHPGAGDPPLPRAQREPPEGPGVPPALPPAGARCHRQHV